MNLPESVTLIEVGMRDGLQSEAVSIPTAQKIAWVAGLVEAGLRKIQVTAFVHPARVPAMADAEALCAALPKLDGVTYSALALNPKGVERAAAAGIAALDLGISASDTHSQKNAGKPTAEALTDFARMVELARGAGISVRGGVQCAFGCVYEGAIPQDRVIGIVRRYLELGIDELALADSTGMANPRQMADMLEAVLPLIGEIPLVLHLHDTRGMGLANALTALQMGVTRFDTAFGGLGGCPFIEGAAGNIATEDTAHLFESMGVRTGVDMGQVGRIARNAETVLGHPLAGKIYRLATETA